MNKKALFASIALLALPVFVFAQVASTPSTPPTGDLIATLNNIIGWMFTLVIGLAVLFLLIAAFYFITAQGDPEKVNSARNFVMYALIGVLVAVLARALISFVADKLAAG